MNGLLQDTKTYAECQILNRSIEDDGLGGYVTTWTRGATFGANIVSDVSTEARIAATQGVRDTYTVYTRTMVLMYNMVFERLSDGKVFRVTSDGDEKQTPNMSSLRLRLVKAEEWSLVE